MSWENDATGYLAELSRSPGARQPATIGEVWASEWKRGGLDTIYGVEQPFNDARDEFAAAIEGAAGKPLKEYALERGIRHDTAVTPAQEQALLGQIADTLPEDKRKAIEPLRDIRLNAARKAQKIEADAEEVSNATYGLSAHATAFMAGVARQSVDPVNLVAMAATGPIGGGTRVGLLRTIGREALANAGAQAVVEPAIEPARAELGLEHGFGRGAVNVLEAGIGGGVLSGVFHLAGRGLRALRSPPERLAPEGTIVAPAAENRTGESGVAPAGRSEPVPAGPLAPASPAEQFAPDDFHAAGDLAARDHVIDAMAPVDTAEGRIDHAAKVDAAAARIESGVRSDAPQESIRSAAIRYDDAVYEGALHSDAYEAAATATGRDFGAVIAKTNPRDSGFVTTTGRFVDREEAARIAHDAGQADRGVSDLAAEHLPEGYFNHVAVAASRRGRLVAEPHSLSNTASWVIRDKTTKSVVMETFDKAKVDALNTEKYEAVPILEYLQGVNASIKAAPDPATVKTVDVQKKKARGRVAADPETWSLFEFLASKGGIRDHKGELAAIFGNARGPFVPGFGPLLRKGGQTIDDALKSAKEAGYLFDPHDADNGTSGVSGRVGLGLIQRDLLDLLDAENRGRKVYKAGHLAPEKFDVAAEEHAILGALDKELYDTGGAAVTDPVIARRVVEIVQKEGETDVLAAYERAIMEDAERYEGLAAARQADAELAKIPGWDPDEPGAASRDGAADPGQRGQAAGAGQKAGGTDGQPSRAAGESAGAPRQLGDPALAADAARAIEEAGGDLEITLQNPDGTTRTLKASDALREVEDDARAADELNACIAGAAEEAPF